MMDDLKRYSLVHGEPEYRAQMLVRPDGKWVKHEEAAAGLDTLRAERDALAARVERLEGAIAGVLDDLEIDRAIPGVVEAMNRLRAALSTAQEATGQS